MGHGFENKGVVKMKANRVLSSVLLCVLSVFLLRPITADSAVWTASNSWNEDWERNYARWIEQEVDVDFLEQAKIKVDCADLCYVVRAVFCRTHSLPFMASDHSGKKIGHYTTAFDSRPTSYNWQEDKRFKAFLERLSQYAGTYSFPYDTYPVELNTETVQPGLLLYENIIASHACFIGRVEPESIIPVIFFEASVPPTVHFLRSTVTDIYVYDEQKDNSESGIARWRWPVYKDKQWQLTLPTLMPHYSEEIYSSQFPYKKTLTKPLNQTAKRLARDKYVNSSFYAYQLANIFYENIRLRLEVVQKAEREIKKNPKQADSKEFDFLYSTYSRDKRLIEIVGQIWAALYEYEIPRADFFHALQQVKVTLSPNLPEANLFHLFIAVDRNWIQPQQNLSVAERWGMNWNSSRQEWVFNKQHTFSEVDTWYRLGEKPSAISAKSH